MNRSALFSTTLISALILIGCGTDKITTGNNRSRSPAPGLESSSVDLDALNLDYQEISGTLTPGLGGLMGDYVTSWGKNCWFGLQVPEGALDPLGPPVNFVMRIPTKESILLHPEIARMIVVRLQPENTLFLEPITVFATWMPWEPYDGSLLPINGSGDYATVQWLPNTNRWRVTWPCDHFSDWEVGPPLGGGPSPGQ